MCGIAGFLNKYSQIDYEKVINKMTDTLEHRGPDDKGIYYDTRVGIALGHRRLSILDLSAAGHQPMTDDEKTIQVVFNGEIYNFLELRIALEEAGYQFKSNSDTEVIIYSYKFWGENCFEHFNGMFAIAIWDSKSKKLILGRDRLGKKPLYFYFNNGNFAFASELKALLEYSGFCRNIEPLSLYRFFEFAYIPSPGSIYKNTYKLEAGHYIVLCDGDLKDICYWDALEVAKARNYKNISFVEAKRKLEELLFSSVKYRLISDVELGAFLSGGIDSSIIVSMMAQSSTHKVKTFTIGFNDEKYNEAVFAKNVANFLGTNHSEIYVEPKDCYKVIENLPYFYDEPFADSSAIPTSIISSVTKRHVTVALSGDGGDELFGGYSQYRYMNKFKWLEAIPLPIKKGVFQILSSMKRSGRYSELLQSLKYGNLSKVYEYVMSYWRENNLNKLFYKRVDINSIFHDSNFLKTFNATEGLKLLERLMLVDIKTYLTDDILTKVDRASMASSLETRAPLLDYRIVEFALSIPLEYKIDKNYDKKILRSVLYDKIPQSFFDRPKTGFVVPVSDWLKNDLNYLVRKYLDKSRLKKQGIFDGELVSQIVGEHMAGKPNKINMLWSMLMFQMWYEKNME